MSCQMCDTIHTSQHYQGSLPYVIGFVITHAIITRARSTRAALKRLTTTYDVNLKAHLQCHPMCLAAACQLECQVAVVGVPAALGQAAVHEHPDHLALLLSLLIRLMGEG